MPSFSEEQIAELLAIITPMVSDSMTIAIETSIASTPVPTLRPGTVQGYTVATNVAQVLVDGDTAAIDATVAGEWPVVGDRVLVLFSPPSAVWVLSIIGHGGVPPSGLIAYLGQITTDTPGSAAAATPPPGFARPYGQIGTSGQYPGLFSAVGSTYNTGGEDAQLGQFRFPDCRGRIFIGLDNMGGSDAGVHSIANTVGTTAGAETHTLSTSNMPSHAHGNSGHTHSFTPSGSVSISSISGSVSGSTSSDGSHSHSSPDGSSFVTGSGGLFDLGTPGTGYNINNSAGSSTQGNGTHSHTFSGSISGASGSGSFSGFGGTTSGGSGSTDYEGSGSSVNHLPPVMVCHWLVKL